MGQLIQFKIYTRKIWRMSHLLPPINEPDCSIQELASMTFKRKKTKKVCAVNGIVAALDNLP